MTNTFVVAKSLFLASPLIRMEKNFWTLIMGSSDEALRKLLL
jgi:hypothetical protein